MTVHADRVQVVTTTTGTGTLALGMATEGHRTFGETVGNGASVTYLLQSGGDWEIGTGTVTTGSPDTLTRVLSSSSTGNLLNLTAGTHIVSLIVAAATLDSIQSRLGKILQVVEANATTFFEITTMNTWTDVALSASITPVSTNSKILVFVNYFADLRGFENGSTIIQARIVRGASTEVASFRQQITFTDAVTGIGGYWYIGNSKSLQALDSPNSTSELTYKLQVRTGTGTIISMVVEGRRSIVLMEVAG
jgi:hypothetical protein